MVEASDVGISAPVESSSRNKAAVAAGTNAEAVPTAHTEAPSTARMSAHTEAAASHSMTTHTAAVTATDAATVTTATTVTASTMSTATAG
jgi:hypothetical protein